MQESRRGARDASVLAVGSLISGLAAYAFIAVGTRTVGSEAFAAVSVLWTLWAMSAAVFTFPVQHWVIRTIEADRSEGRVRRAQAPLLVASLVLGVALGGVSFLFRFQLFGDGQWTYPCLAAVIPIGSVLMGLNRGMLAARRRFTSTAVAVAGENLLRLGLSLLAASAAGLALALVGGFGIAALWPSSFRIGSTGGHGRQISPLAFVGGVAGGSLIGQIVLTIGPVVLALVGGSPRDVTGLFSALALFRAPYMIAMGVAVRLTGSLTRLVLDEDGTRVRRVIVRALAITALTSAVGWFLARSIGPTLLQTVFGDDVILGAGPTALVGVASVLALCSLFLTLVMIADARVIAVSMAWIAAAIAGCIYVVRLGDDPVTTVAGGFLVSELVAVITIAAVLLTKPIRSAD